MSSNKVSVKGVLGEAKADNKDAIKQLFSGFLAKGEEINDCGYLGEMGFIFSESSFWCVTPLRVCALRIKKGGELFFQGGYISEIKSDAFYQPSLVMLWIILIIIALSTFGIGLVLTPWIVKSFYKMRKSGVVFWMESGLLVYLFADRSSLKKAQALAVQIAAAKGKYIR